LQYTAAIGLQHDQVTGGFGFKFEQHSYENKFIWKSSYSFR
jgi:hypothetical protein